MKKIKPDSEREHMVRRYRNCYVLLREIFNIPNNEMIISFHWDKGNGELILETMKD